MSDYTPENADLTATTAAVQLMKPKQSARKAGKSAEQSPAVAAFMDEFLAAMHDAGLIPKAITADGQIHRCPTKDKPHGQDGAYLLRPDGTGGFQNWRDGDEWQLFKTDSLPPDVLEWKNNLVAIIALAMEQGSVPSSTIREFVSRSTGMLANQSVRKVIADKAKAAKEQAVPH